MSTPAFLVTLQSPALPTVLPEISFPIRKVLAKSFARCATIGMATLAAVSIATAQPSSPPPPSGQPAKSAAPTAAKAKQEPPPAPGSQTFNTVITKLKAGKKVFCNTITEPDLEAAKKACEGQDYIWIEMQHATLTWRETQQLIKVVAQAGCIPFVRVPSANGGDIPAVYFTG